MATLKGAYQRFVTSILRLWKGDDQDENSDVKDQSTSSRGLSDVKNQDFDKNPTPGESSVDYQPDTLPVFRIDSDSNNAGIPKNLSSTDIDSSRLRPKSVYTPHSSAPELPVVANSNFLRPPRSESRLTLDRSPKYLSKLRSENSSFKYSPRTRKERPKSLSDSVIPDFKPGKPKLKKSPTYLKLSPSIFRKNGKVSSDAADSEPETPKVKSGGITSGFSRLSKRIDGTLRRKNKTETIVIKRVMGDIDIGNDKTMSADQFAARLRDYNTYYDEKPFQQFKWKQDKTGDVLVDGMLNIYWGLKRSIRLQMADSSEKIRPQSQMGIADDAMTAPLAEEENLDKSSKRKTISGTLLRKKINKVAETLTNEEETPVINIENGILGETSHRSYDRRRMALRLKNGGERVRLSMEVPDDGQMRQKSVVLRKRLTNKSSRKRFSINGHAYNYETSVFTPKHGSVTNVRVTSRSTCEDVIRHLLNKFRVENGVDEFSLFLVKETEERRELNRNEFPLVTRVLSGPNEQVCKIFLMDRHVHRDISSEVAQYIKLDLNILQMFVKKFSEEEERETQKMKTRYEMYKKMLQRRIAECAE